jgi:Ulp1 family protease
MPSSEPEKEVELLEPPPDESVVAVAATKKRKEPTNDGLTAELRPRTRRQKKDKGVTPAKKDNIEFMKVDENMPTENEDSHLHIFPTGSSGKDRLLSVLKSDFTQPGSMFNKKIALYVDVENRDRWVTYKDFIRYKEKDYISSNVVNAYFWLLDQRFENIKFGDSFVYSAMQDEYFEDDKLKRQILAKWPESIDALFLPINIDDNHWVLAVVNKRVKTIDVYDSLRYKNGKEIKLLINNLDMVLDNNSVWKVNNGYNVNIQRQLDSHSCAFFTCWYAYQLATGGSLETWSTNIDWRSRVEKIAECVYVSIVDRKVAVIKKF